MRRVVILIFLFFVCGCSGLPERRLSDVGQPTTLDPAVLGTDVLGITMGMTPRRVLAEFDKNNWELGKLSEMTLEDMIESRKTNGAFYFDAVRPKPGTLEVHFNKGKVIFARHTYEISEQGITPHIEQAKLHLRNLGNFTEDISLVAVLSG